MSKLWRVISNGETEQVLLETSAENVTVADTGEKLEATTVEGALIELADGVNEARRANIIDVGQGTPTTENGNTITPVNFIFSNGTNKTVNIYAKQGEKGDSGVDDYEELKSKPIIYAILNSISNPVENTYYKHVGETTERFINGYIYLYTGGQYKAIDGSGGGAASITYTKLSGDVEFSSTSPSASSAFFVNTDVANWAVNETMGRKALTNTSDLGLVVGNSYTMGVTIDGTSYTFSGTANDGTEYGVSGVKILGLVNESKGGFSIFDHCDYSAGYPKADNGAIIVSGLSSTPTSAMITNFSGGLKIVSPATITNSAIKVNSSITMYINSSLVVSGTKTDGSITLTASTEGSLSYEMEILDTPTEGLFEIVNAYVPTVPNSTSELSNDSGFLTKDNFVAGDNVTITNENDNLIISATGGGGGGGGAPQWNTIYEDTTGSGAVSVELSEPLQAGGLYRITFGGSVYMFCSPNTGRASYQGGFTISTEVFQDATTMGHLTYNFTHRNTSLSLDYLAQYTITADGVSNISFANNSTIQVLKITKVEVYR